MLEDKLGFCLASPQIQEWIQQGKIIANLDDLVKGSRIQPSSLDPAIDSEAFILDSETQGIFRPRPDMSVYRTILELPYRQRRKVSISDGFEIKVGYSYLIHLIEKVKLESEERIKSSPKSSLGRTFLKTRLMSDFNPCFDEIMACYCQNKELDLWLLLQPEAFNLIIYPGLSLNQVRFMTGADAALSAKELLEEFKKNPLLYTREEGNRLVPAQAVISDDRLQLHLNLRGKDTAGIVGLRARNNPDAIDLRRAGELDAALYFEPVTAKDCRISIMRGDKYLLASKEVLDTPSHLNCELEEHSHIGITGPLHYAGFIDNGFKGDLVFEIRSDELERMVLEDGMPTSRLRYFRTGVPEKLYGSMLGSHYQGQTGPKVAKYFKAFDYEFAAKNYAKLNRDVLVQDAKVLLGFRKSQDGFEEMSLERSSGLFDAINSGFFHSCYDCEDDTLILQPIPYIMIFGPNKTVFSYVRAKDITKYLETKLFGKRSVGIGGHINRSDSPDYVTNCLMRELGEEVRIEGRMSKPRFVGTLMAHDKPVDRVHLGLIYVIYTDGAVFPKESSMASGGMVDIDDIWNPSGISGEFETWSRMLIDVMPTPRINSYYAAKESGIDVIIDKP